MVRDRLIKILETAVTDDADADDRPVAAFDGGTTSGAPTSSDRTVTQSRIEDAYDDSADDDLQQAQSVHLGHLLDDPAGRIEDANDLGQRHADAGVSATAFTETYEATVELLVTQKFEELERELSDDDETVELLQRAETELESSLSAVLSDMRAGLDAYDSPADATDSIATEDSDAIEDASDGDEADADEEGDELNVEDDELLDGLSVPVFMIDTQCSEVVAWNSALEDLTGVSAEEAFELDDVSTAFYDDAAGTLTLAEKVARAPETADEEFDVERADTERTLYTDAGTMTDGAGDEREIEYSAMPLYDDDELIAVVETVRDRTEDVRRQEGITSLVEELIGTLEAMERGDLSARASFEDEHDVVDDALVEVVDQVNAMAEQFETLTARVGEKTEELEASVEKAADSADVIDERVEQQADQLTEVARQMESFSASMQEVAASSDQVASAAEQAKASADSGLESSEGAREATDEVIEMSDDLVDTVTELESQMHEIEDVVEVIAEVADQTNLLALNANIEAARAGDAGSGFEVVANEVKDLANETREHTEEIAGRIENIQEQANETVVAVEESNEQVKYAGEEMQDVLVALDEIADAVEEAATGVTEVAEANDEQATNVEEVMATVEDVRDDTYEVEDATDDIVSATRDQTQAIDELSERVDQMRSDS